MPRKPRSKSQTLPFHVTVRCNNGEPFPLPLEKAWPLFCHALYEAVVLYDLKIHAAVLMPNHLHLVCSTPQEGLDLVMKRVLQLFTQDLCRYSGRTGRIFSSRYFSKIIDSLDYYETVLKYVYRNPVRAKLVEQVEDYPFSTLHGQLGFAPSLLPLSIPVVPVRGVAKVTELHTLLEWLNTPFPVEEESSIRRKLYLRCRNPSTKKSSPQNTEEDC